MSLLLSHTHFAIQPRFSPVITRILAAAPGLSHFFPMTSSWASGATTTIYDAVGGAWSDAGTLLQVQEFPYDGDLVGDFHFGVGVYNLNNIVDFDFSAFSVSFWYWPYDPAVSGVPFSYRDDTSNRTFIYSDGTGPNFIANVTNGGVDRSQSMTSTTEIVEGRWAHFGYTVNGATVKLYSNGYEKASTSTTYGSQPQTDFNRVIAASRDTGSNRYAGALAHFALYHKRAISPAEMLAVYQATALNDPLSAYEADAETSFFQVLLPPPVVPVISFSVVQAHFDPAQMVEY